MNFATFQRHFLNYVRLYRYVNGITQEAMAEQLGVSTSTYNRYELGKLELPLTSYMFLCDICYEYFLNDKHFLDKQNEQVYNRLKETVKVAGLTRKPSKTKHKKTA